MSKSSQANVTQVVGPYNTISGGLDLGNYFVFYSFYCSYSPIAHNTTHTSSTSPNSPWTLDSGATDHITSSLKWFQYFSKIKPITIKFPNESSVTSQYLSTIYFSSSLVLYNVLYIPDFTFNLICISKLIFTLSCKLIFYDHLCEIQDLSSLKMISLAKLEDGLYHLVISKKEWCSALTSPFINSFVATLVITTNIWHFLLGHLSGKRLNISNQDFPFISKQY